MTPSSLIVLLAACIAPLVNGDYPIQCPFSPDCNCTQSASPVEFDSAICVPPNLLLPTFQGGDSTYTIYDQLDLVFSAYKLPARAFSPFEEIGFLNLKQPTLALQKLMWETNAFADTKIKGLAITNVDQVIPPPSHLYDQADNLEQLHFIHCGGSATLGSGVFSRFKNLKVLLIQDSNIVSVDSGAFTGLDGLGELWLLNTNLQTYPTNAIKGLSKLYRIDLTNSNIQHFTKSDFTPFPELIFLVLDGNNVQAAIDSQALLNMPKSVITLFLQNSSPGLTQVPTSVIAKAPQVTVLSLARNAITAIKNGDFPKGNELSTLVLSDNPIASIESGAMQNLATVYNLALAGSKLTSFDFSLLKGMNSLQSVDLSNGSVLTSLNVTDIDTVPSSISLINAKNTPLQTINPDLEYVISQKYFRTLDISDVETLICDNSTAWMARYILCTPTRIWAPNTRCKNGGSLADFLASTVTDPCVPRTTTPRPTRPPTTKGASTLSASIVITAAIAAMAMVKSA